MKSWLHRTQNTGHIAKLLPAGWNVLSVHAPSPPDLQIPYTPHQFGQPEVPHCQMTPVFHQTEKKRNQLGDIYMAIKLL